MKSPSRFLGRGKTVESSREADPEHWPSIFIRLLNEQGTRSIASFRISYPSTTASIAKAGLQPLLFRVVRVVQRREVLAGTEIP